MLLPTTVLADSTEIVGGGLTYHITDSTNVTEANSNKVSSNGRLIDNPLLGATFVQNHSNKFQSESIFGGSNSIGKPIGGALYENGYQFGHWQLGLAAGGYLQNDNAFAERNIHPTVLTDVNGTGLAPILGGAINYQVDISKRMYIKLNNVITPTLTNTTLAIGWYL